MKESDEASEYCAPGLVKWHKDLQSACDSSARTARPVLLFAMLGNLDEEFC